MFIHKKILMFVLLISAEVAIASNVTVSNTFVAGQVARASEVNQNFTDVKTAVDDNNNRLATLESLVSSLGLAADYSNIQSRMAGDYSGVFYITTVGKEEPSYVTVNSVSTDMVSSVEAGKLSVTLDAAGSGAVTVDNGTSTLWTLANRWGMVEVYDTFDFNTGFAPDITDVLSGVGSGSLASDLSTLPSLLQESNRSNIPGRSEGDAALSVDASGHITGTISGLNVIGSINTSANLITLSITDVSSIKTQIVILQKM